MRMTLTMNGCCATDHAGPFRHLDYPAALIARRSTMTARADVTDAYRVTYTHLLSLVADISGPLR